MNDDLQIIEDAFNAIPPEVQEYMYSDEFNQKLSQLFTDTAIPSDKQTALKGTIFGFFAQREDEESLDAAVLEATVNETDRKKINDWLNINVYQKLLALVTEAYANEDEPLELDSDIPAPITPSATPSPLESLSTTLTKPSASTNTRRDYSLDTNPAVAPSENTRTIDPYHEPIDNI